MGSPGPFTLTVSDAEDNGRVLNTARFDQNVVTIGRSRTANFVIDSMTVSRMQAELLRTSQGFALFAHPSPNIVVVRGQRVDAEQTVPVKPGDPIRIAEQYDIRLELATPQGDVPEARPGDAAAERAGPAPATAEPDPRPTPRPAVEPSAIAPAAAREPATARVRTETGPTQKLAPLGAAPEAAREAGANKPWWEASSPPRASEARHAAAPPAPPAPPASTPAAGPAATAASPAVSLSAPVAASPPASPAPAVSASPTPARPVPRPSPASPAPAVSASPTPARPAPRPSSASPAPAVSASPTPARPAPRPSPAPQPPAQSGSPTPVRPVSAPPAMSAPPTPARPVPAPPPPAQSGSPTPARPVPRPTAALPVPAVSASPAPGASAPSARAQEGAVAVSAAQVPVAPPVKVEVLASARQRQGPPGARLLCNLNGSMQTVFVHDDLYVGGADDSDVKLSGAYAPRRAAILVRVDRTYRVYNTSPLPETVLVNGKGIEGHTNLVDGDEITVYGSSMTFEIPRDDAR